MKKTLKNFVTASIFALTLAAAPAFAGGSLDISVGADGHGFDSDHTGTIFHGIGYTDGVAYGGAQAEAGAIGGTLNGTINGEVNALAGSFDQTISDRGHVQGGYFVGTTAQNYTDIEASSKLTKTGFFGGGVGAIEGSGGEATEANSGITTPSYFNGGTVGHAEQNADGAFVGAMVLGPCSNCAKVEADIDINGMSYSDSYNYKNGGVESVTTNVGSITDIDTAKVEKNGYVLGGYHAAGEAVSGSVIWNNNGGANASAEGAYSGSGNIGTNYDGKAIGGAAVQTATQPGYNGTISSANAGMNVTSIVQ